MPNKPTKILVVDDEPQIRRFLRTSLSAQDYQVLEAETGQEALDGAKREKPELMILDLGLPDIDGLEVIRRIRENSALPIIVLSSRDDELVKVEALDLGADDYITKPFGMEELTARVRAALRHRLQEQGVAAAIVTGDLKIDLVQRLISRGGEPIKLSPKEFDILRLLATHAGKVLTHRFILQQVWGTANAEDVQYLRAFIRLLRQKIEPQPDRPIYVVTETGVGYRLKMLDEAP
ncbi:MAG TPA: response regulator [Aliidongia sp.]|nr:response regulator [Aliidongia sp.]